MDLHGITCLFCAVISYYVEKIFVGEHPITVLYF